MKEAHKVRWVLKVSLAFLEALAPQARMVHMAGRVQLVLLDFVARLVKKARVGCVVLLVPRVLLDQLAFVDRQDLRVLMGNRVVLVFAEILVLKVRRVILDLKAAVAKLGLLVWME